MDLTHISTLEGGLFLARVADSFSRRIVGRAMAAAMTSRLVVDAKGMAVPRREVAAGLIAHSGRGSQYASEHSRSELRRAGWWAARAASARAGITPWSRARSAG